MIQTQNEGEICQAKKEEKIDQIYYEEEEINQNQDQTHTKIRSYFLLIQGKKRGRKVGWRKNKAIVKVEEVNLPKET